MPSFPPFLFMSTAQEGRLSSKRRFPELGTYAPGLLNPVSRRSVRRHRNRGSYRPQNRAKCGHFIPGLTASAQPAYDRLLKAEGEPQNWLTYSGSYRRWRYSSLNQIDRANAQTRKLA